MPHHNDPLYFMRIHVYFMHQHQSHLSESRKEEDRQRWGSWAMGGNKKGLSQWIKMMCYELEPDKPNSTSKEKHKGRKGGKEGGGGARQ